MSRFRTRAPHRPPRSQTSLWCLEVRFSIALAHQSDAVPLEPGARSTSGVRSEACGWLVVGGGSFASMSSVVWRGKMSETARAYVFAHASHADHGGAAAAAASRSDARLSIFGVQRCQCCKRSLRSIHGISERMCVDQFRSIRSIGAATRLTKRGAARARLPAVACRTARVRRRYEQMGNGEPAAAEHAWRS